MKFKTLLYNILRIGRTRRHSIDRFLSMPRDYLRASRLLIFNIEKDLWKYGKDEMILHACFQLLTDYVECERPDEWIAWDSDSDHKHAWDEMKDLYYWWKEERPNRVDPLDSIERIPPLSLVLGNDLSEDDKRASFPEWYSAGDESTRLETLWHDEDQSNLHRLINIRPYMWT